MKRKHYENDHLKNKSIWNEFYKRYMKRVLDIIISVLAMIILSPIILILMILIKIKIGSPIIFKQERPGLNEEIFTMYKFRTMTNERDAFGNFLPDEKRLTPFGLFLRSSSLDELPELYNVLKGEMSIVGPRPLLVKYLPLYNDFQRRRHEVLPGVVGLAGVKGRNNQSWDSKFDKDIEYVENLSFKLDLKIFIMAIFVVLKRDGVNLEGSVTTIEFDGKEIPKEKESDNES